MAKAQGSPFYFVAVHSPNPGTVFAGGGGVFIVSADEGETRSAFDARGLNTLEVNCLAFDPSDSDSYWAGTRNGVFSYTLKATGGGPVISQVSPATGRAGDSVQITGERFGQTQSTSKVMFGSIDAGVAQTWSDTDIKATVPAGVRTGSVSVTVLNKKSNPYEFIVLPASGNVEPTSGPASGGTRVTVLTPAGTSGTQFNVLFGAAVATSIRFTAPNIITCDSPPGTGTVDVKVTSSVTSTTVGPFTYQ